LNRASAIRQKAVQQAKHLNTDSGDETEQVAESETHNEPDNDSMEVDDPPSVIVIEETDDKELC
jgi:hypothetical protein